MKPLRAIDVCSGGGGWAVAARGLPIEIVAAFDCVEECLATYAENHPGVHCELCDVVEHDFSEWSGEVDLVLGGIPCELISQARANRAPKEEDLAGLRVLIDKCLAIPVAIGAAYWCYEDVPGLQHHLPLMTSHFFLDSAEFSPQRRKRIYVGNLPKPAGRGDTRTLRDCVLPGPYRRSLQLKDREPCRSHVYSGGKFYPWMLDEKSPTVLSQNSRHDNYAAIEIGDNWRQVEWKESALLQGFPRDYVFIGSPTSVHQQIGQAVQIDTARAILEALCREHFGLAAEETATADRG